MFVHLLVRDIAKRSKGVRKAEPAKEVAERPASAPKKDEPPRS
jgi:hypothetical protein